MSRILGIDYGTKRIGLAISDGLGMTARPLDVVKPAELITRITEISDEYEISLIVMGLPTGLGGSEGSSAEGARLMGDELTESLGIEVEYLDERFTSRIAESSLLEAGMKRRQRRATVDKVAAAIILQDYLDAFPR